MKGNHRALSARERYKLGKWIEENKENAFMESEKAAGIASEALKFTVSPSSILTHRAAVYPEYRRASPIYRPGAKTYQELLEKYARLESRLISLETKFALMEA